MKAQQVLKVVLVIAILMSLAKLFVTRRRPAWNVQPYALERFDDNSEYDTDYEDEDYEDEDYEDSDDYEDEDAEDEDEEDEDENEFRNDVAEMTMDDNTQEGYVNDDDPEDEDDEYDEDYEQDEDYEVEGFANNSAQPSGMMNVATDLLPKPTWKDQNFSEFAPKSLLGQNFMDTKKYIGVDTKGSSLRNPSYDLRSTPSIPRKDIGPWAQSTIDTDLYRKPLE